MNTAKLIAATKPVDGSTAAELLSYCARVSNPKNARNYTTGPKLLRSLIRDSHWSPLEMVNLLIEVTTTRDIGRQIIRHTSFRFQEFSQRYAVVEDDPVLREARLQDKKNRQNSIETDDEDLKEWWESAQYDVYNAAIDAYNCALDEGIAKEQARAVLPEGMTKTTMHINATLRSWVHYCVLRMGNGTQSEHIEVANNVWAIVKEQFPDICEAIESMQEEEAATKKRAEYFMALLKADPDFVLTTLSKIDLDISP